MCCSAESLTRVALYQLKLEKIIVLNNKERDRSPKVVSVSGIKSTVDFDCVVTVSHSCLLGKKYRVNFSQHFVVVLPPILKVFCNHLAIFMFTTFNLLLIILMTDAAQPS